MVSQKKIEETLTKIENMDVGTVKKHINPFSIGDQVEVKFIGKKEDGEEQDFLVKGTNFILSKNKELNDNIHTLSFIDAFDIINPDSSFNDVGREMLEKYYEWFEIVGINGKKVKEIETYEKEDNILYKITTGGKSPTFVNPIFPRINEILAEKKAKRNMLLQQKSQQLTNGVSNIQSQNDLHLKVNELNEKLKEMEKEKEIQKVNKDNKEKTGQNNQ